MTTIAAAIRRHPVGAYFALTVGLTWGAMLWVAGGPGGITPVAPPADTVLSAVYLAMLVGPALAGLLCTGIADGRAGFRALRSRLFRWRVSAGWYAAALLAAPAVWLAVLLPLTLLSPAYVPAVLAPGGGLSLLLAGLGVGLFVGACEELGWTGFAVPRLAERMGTRATGSVVGLVWGAWHLPVFYWGGEAYWGSVPGALVLAVQLFSFLPPFRVLMVWVYSRTGSLLVAILMHASLVVCTLALSPAAVAGAPLIVSDLAWAAVLWILALAATRLRPTAPAR